MYFLKTTIIAAVLAGTYCNAQIVGTDAFIKGNFLEVGINSVGSFGSDAVSPTGYHSHMFAGIGASQLGFVSDAAMDGWTTGTPSMMGDFFLPGYPYEGWTLQIGSEKVNAGQHGGVSSFALSGGMGPCTGSNISHAATGRYVTSTWQGTVDSIDVKQVTTLDTSGLYIVVKVTLTNLAVAPQNNIYYARDMDPDNESTWAGSSVTRNKIEHQMPSSFGASVVSAKGNLYPSMSYMALGTTDTASRVVAFPSLYMSAAPSSYYSGTGTSLFSVSDSNYADHGIGLIIRIPHLATVDSAGDSVYRTTAGSTLHPANSASFSFFYAFSRAGVDSAIAYINNTGSSAGTLSIQHVATTAEIRAYPNPSGDRLNITNLLATDRIAIIDMMGRDAGQKWPIYSDGTNTFVYSNVPAGPYVVVISDANGNVKAKIPVMKQ